MATVCAVVRDLHSRRACYAMHNNNRTSGGLGSTQHPTRQHQQHQHHHHRGPGSGRAVSPQQARPLDLDHALLRWTTATRPHATAARPLPPTARPSRPITTLALQPRGTAKAANTPKTPRTVKATEAARAAKAAKLAEPTGAAAQPPLGHNYTSACTGGERWPPCSTTLLQLLQRRPPQPPYLSHHHRHRARALLVNRTRQLFVDDYVLHNRTAARRCHQARFKAVILKPTPHEWSDVHAKRADFELRWVGRARPYSGGVHFDAADGMYKLFYSCSWTWNGNSGTGRACIALSRDGVEWWRPNITAPERSPN